ncbi:hypothetical protein GCM10007897_23570 [Sphingobium jiangsuense]|nr:hypothetical protein GCM10007897_23570 [Sphingobium jiangsuense]
MPSSAMNALLRGIILLILDYVPESVKQTVKIRLRPWEMPGEPLPPAVRPACGRQDGTGEKPEPRPRLTRA